MQIKLYKSSAFQAKPIYTALAALVASTGIISPVKADPPVGSLPLFCFRFTDIKSIGNPAANNFQFEFEILNWTSQYADKLTVTFPRSGQVASDGSSLNRGVNITTAFIDIDGRRLTPGQAQPLPGNVAPTNNDWTTTFINNPSSSFTRAIYEAYTPIPNIDISSILAGGQHASVAVARVNALNPPGGHFPNRDFNPLGDIETIDNGTNVLDGFVFEAHSFDPGDSFVYEWQLGPDSQNPGGQGIGVITRDQPMELKFSRPINGIAATRTSLNRTLFAPVNNETNSPLVGTQYKFAASVSAGVPGVGSVSGFTSVPGPLPIMGVAAFFGYSRKLRRRLSNTKTSAPIG
jgi:hypothetical protein